MSNYITIGDVATNDVLTAAYLNQIVGDFEILGKHNHSPSPGEGNKVVISQAAASALVSQFHFCPSHSIEFFATLNISTGTASEMIGCNIWGFNFGTAAVSGNGASIQLPLLKGIYKLQFAHLTSPSGGTVTIALDASALTSLDTYSATAGSAIYTQSNISIPTSACISMAVVLTLSNALSATCIVKIGIMNIRKTSNG